MTKTEYEILETKNDVLISGADLGPNSKNRTLLYGYTYAYETFHVYIKDGDIHVVIYKTQRIGKEDELVSMREVEITTNDDYIPERRLNPERCDFKFCEMLAAREYPLPFTCWTDGVEEKDFYGLTLEDFVK